MKRIDVPAAVRLVDACACITHMASRTRMLPWIQRWWVLEKYLNELQSRNSLQGPLLAWLYNPSVEDMGK